MSNPKALQPFGFITDNEYFCPADLNTMRNYFFCLPLLVLCLLWVSGCKPLEAEAGTEPAVGEGAHVEGIVQRGEDRKPMVGAKVFVMNGQKVLACYTTGNDGHFDFIIPQAHLTKPQLHLLIQKTCNLNDLDNRKVCTLIVPAPRADQTDMRIGLGGCAACGGSI
jgi:hypothetical protein